VEHHFVSELWPDGNVPGPFGPFFRTRSTQNVSIFVGNLPFRAEQEDVTELFAQFGEVVNCALPLERDTGRKRGFAFVEMSDDAAEEAAIEGLQGAELMGRPLRINKAEPRGSAPRRGGGGGYGGGGGGGGGYGGGGGSAVAATAAAAVAVATAVAAVAVATAVAAAEVEVVIALLVPVVGKIAVMAPETVLLPKVAMPMTKAVVVVVAPLVAVALVPVVVTISLVTAELRANRPSAFSLRGRRLLVDVRPLPKC
jgi:hypothetical protein